jgi:L-ascorbate metabolism protein UlaG (beta-lactamase superfamily)
MPLIQAFQKDQDLLQDIQAFIPNEGFKVWWLGQSGFLIKWQGKYLLFDPYLSDSLSIKYQNTDKPHTRMSELVINPQYLDFIDIVTSSHNHTDHLDAETLQPIISQRPDIQLIIPEANRDFVVNRLQINQDFPIGMNDTEVFDYQGFRITGIPAAHNELERDEKGQCKFMGFVVEFGDFSVYHSGDTLWFAGLEDILKPFQLDIAFLPINGNKPERRVAGNLNFEEAAQLGKVIDAQLVIPHHYHLFEFNTEDPENFVKACQKHQTPHRVLKIGEGYWYQKKEQFKVIMN